nr:EOG090X09D3 [Sida crystallina]
MLPLNQRDPVRNVGRLSRIKETVAGWLRLILSDKNSRNILLFLMLNFSFAFVELFYGIWTNSLGLISDSFHMFFDCTGLLAGLAASVITKWKANDNYSYGYVRAEVLAGFVNGLFLLFISFFILSEAVERFIEPPEVKHERLFVVSVLGFIVNLIGIFAFHHGHSHGGGGHGHSHGGGGHGHSHSHDAEPMTVVTSYGKDHSNHFNSHSQNHGHSHSGGASHGHSHGTPETVQPPSGRSQIMDGVFLHILADTLGSVGVIISAILMHLFGWMVADPVCSMFIAILIGLSVLGLIKDSVMILMQRQPKELDSKLPACYQRVAQLDGVLSVQEPHFWTLCSNVYVGALKLELTPRADARYVTQNAQAIFQNIGVNQLHVHLDYAQYG